MAAKQLYGPLSANLGAVLDGLAIDGRVVIEIDNSTNRHLSDCFDLECVGTGTGEVAVYVAGSNTAGNFPAAADNKDLWVFVKSLPMASTKKKIDWRSEGLHKYNAYMIHNNSGAALGAGNTLYRIGVDVENV